MMEEASDVSMYQACLMHARADRALRMVVSKQLVEFDLTMMEWLLLATICSAGREGMTMSAVAGALDVTLPQITALANSLIKTNLVKQKVNSADRRSRYLIITIAGKRLMSRVEEAIENTMRSWLGDIPHDQFESYMRTVELIAKLPTDKAG